MNPEEHDALVRRVEALEKELAGLRGRRVAEPPPLPTANPEAGMKTSSEAVERAKTLLNLENMLSKAGVVLLVVGVLLLLKLAVDQGWFTPWARVTAGWAVGVALLVAGVRLAGRRVVLGQALFGGGWAVVYGVTVAGAQLYDLYGPAAGFGVILAVTVAGFWFALARNSALPAGLALGGGLAAPFVLGATSGLAVVPVVVYALVLLAAAAVAYQKKGWGGVYWTGFAVGALVLLALEGEISTVRGARGADQFALTMAWLFWWGMHGWLPVQRVAKGGGRGDANALHVVVFAGPALVLTGLARVWDWGVSEAGWATLGAGLLLYGGSRLVGGAHRSSHQLAAGLLGACGVVMVLEGDASFVVVVALAVGLAEAARRTREGVLEACAHVAALVMGGWWLVRMAEPAVGAPLWRFEALVNLAGVGALFWIFGLRAGSVWRWVYWVAGVPFLMAWMAREAGVSAAPQAWTSAAWGALALALLVGSVVFWDAAVRRTGMVVLGVVLGKLILVDLATLDAVWRVLLFLGLGGLMLLCSYLLPRLAGWRAREQGPEEPPPLPPPLP